MVRSRDLAILFAGDKLFCVAEYNPNLNDRQDTVNYHRTAAVWAD